MTPGRPNGSTAVRIISQRVAPRASAASLCVAGVWANTSRERAVTIGRTMIASTMPMKKMVPELSTWPVSLLKNGIQPRTELQRPTGRR